MAASRKSKSKRRFHRHSKPGANPGTIAVDPQAAAPQITVMALGPAGVSEQKISRTDDLLNIVQRHHVTWINVDGLGDANLIKTLGKLFNLHPLALEDTINVHQRPKVEQYPEQLFIVTRMIHEHETISSEQLSMFLGENFVLTFQEAQPGDCFDQVRERIRSEKDGFTKYGADYLAYRLLDAVIDSFFPVLEHYGEKIDDMEELLLQSPQQANLNKIHAIKQDLLLLRRSIWPTRELINTLLRDHNPLIKDETRVYLRDCYDHTVQLLDLLEMYRELGADLRDLYLSSMSHRMNEVMKVLTIISTLFIPLTFIAGVYGMNFETDKKWNMPELRWEYGYLFCWGVMLVITIGMLIYFWRKRWIGESWRRKPAIEHHHSAHEGHH
jgi:magnesium transporter